jgi:hypothetical protein
VPSPSDIRRRRLALKPPPTLREIARRAPIAAGHLSQIENGWVPQRSAGLERVLALLDKLEAEQPSNGGTRRPARRDPRNKAPGRGGPGADTAAHHRRER